MKKLTLLFCLLLSGMATFAFESYQDSAVLINDDIVATEGKDQTYKDWTIYNARGFEFSGHFIKNTHDKNSTEQYIQIKKFTSDPYSWVKLPEVGFPIEEIELWVGSNAGERDSAIIYPRFIYFIKENFPGKWTDGSANDTINGNLIIRQEVTGLHKITLKIDEPTATTGYIVAGDDGGFRIWDIKLKWTVDKMLPCSSLEIVPKTLTLGVGATDSLTVKLTPINAVETLTWKSLDETKATVANGKVTAHATGEVGIVAYSTDQSKTDTCWVTVRPHAESIAICLDAEPIDTLNMIADVTGNIFDTENLDIQFLPDGAFVEEISWKSTNDKVVSIDQKGYAVAQNVGKAHIVAISESGLKDSCLVIVKDKLLPEKVIISEHLLEFNKGDYTTLSATVLPDELDEDLKDVSWTSLNERVATARASNHGGYVEAVGAGTTYIVATTYNGISDSCKIVVSGKPTEGEYYVKVTSEPENWSGKYLIVCEENNLAMDGSLDEFDVAKNTKTISISDEAIAATDATNAISFTISPIENGYSIKGASGKFIGYNAADTEYGNKNGLQTSTNALLNSISLDDTNAKIVGADGSQLLYNSDTEASGKTEIFRYYQKTDNPILVAIQLYRYIGAQTALKTVTLDNVYFADGIVHNANNLPLEIYNVSGILLTSGNENINISDFSSGVYIVKSGNGLLKIIK